MAGRRAAGRQAGAGNKLPSFHIYITPFFMFAILEFVLQTFLNYACSSVCHHSLPRTWAFRCDAAGTSELR